MKLNNDLSAHAVASSENAVWVPSPQPGVERRMLERDGDEKVQRATSVVRYDANATFPRHVHDGGEEFLVLEGTFSDVTGNFGKGFYVRNPVGSSHAPWSKEGTQIFVKLGQIDPHDKAFVRLDTQGADWRCIEDQGLRTLLLHRFGPEYVRLVDLKQRVQFPETEFLAGVEIFVVSGQLEISGDTRIAGDWMRAPAGSSLSIGSEAGAMFYIKTGHLLNFVDAA